MLSGQLSVKDKHVVITGGSQGLGAEMGRQLVLKGASSVTLIARTETKLKAVVNTIKEVRVSDKQVVSYIAADVSVYKECEDAVRSLEFAPDLVFLCAGSSIPKLLLDLTPKELEQGVAVNYNTALFFSHAVFKRMATSPAVPYARHIVFCSSVLALYPFIGYGQYAPSKAAIRSLSDIMRHEGLPFNIKVACVYAGNFASEGFAEEEKTKPVITREIEGPSSPITVEKCAEIVLWWLDRGYQTIYTDMIGWFLGAGSLGFSPRVAGLLQIVVALLLAIIGPIYVLICERDIKKFFKKQQ
ncbi:CYFA0S12e04258g1_1 [Cyberlindnera fabianii]|uniref:3-ketodihydrosphingosine reductase TSC10 n=1 Tax=Cyberlindnera fabianii TaxID=36022 RepID=A0A061B1T2_CYBFA|nr:hypothetical protein BON22_4713 [Cyberlindnera fabianii]CDR43780.1 CYFA0S12e04258g1_1 [Cyberlindnera fabianii]